MPDFIEARSNRQKMNRKPQPSVVNYAAGPAAQRRTHKFFAYALSLFGGIVGLATADGMLSSMGVLHTTGGIYFLQVGLWLTLPLVVLLLIGASRLGACRLAVLFVANAAILGLSEIAARMIF
jgi:hypothetical protein